MSNPLLDTSVLQDRIDRWRSGDREAADELVRLVMARMEKLAHRMLRTFPNIHGQVETADVLQNSLLRLLATLHRIKPDSTRDFFNLAALQIRWELLDIARKTRGKKTVSLQASETDPQSHTETDEAQLDDADRWVRFHKAVDLLPAEEREVVGLVFYHGWKKRQIAELFQVDPRTIRRYWTEACKRLQSVLGSDFFER